MAKAFKVLQFDQTSIVANGYAKVQYKEGRFVTAPLPLAQIGFHLCVFMTLETATAAMAEFSWPGEIWEVDARGEVPLAKGTLSMHRFEKDGMVIYRPSDSDPGWAEGSKMYKKVKLIRRVDG